MIKKIEERFLKGNFQFQHKIMRGFEDLQNIQKNPRIPVLILTCMDHRIDVHRIFQLNKGDVIILRNAGNIATEDMLRSINLAIYKHDIKNIIILGHTECGMSKVKLRELKEKLSVDLYQNITKEDNKPFFKIREYFNVFVDEFKNLINQMEYLIKSKEIPSGIEITGMLYDTNSGWVFEYNKLMNFRSLDEFIINHSELCKLKRLELIDLMEEFEEKTKDASINEVRRETELRPELETELETELKKEYHKGNEMLEAKIKINYPKIKINYPKINYPKIKINIPKVYKREK